MRKTNHLVITFLLSILYSQIIYSQDVDEAKFYYQFIQRPTKPLDLSLETFYVKVLPSNTRWGNKFGNEIDEDKFELRGYHRLQTSSDADIFIEMKLVEDLVYDKAEANHTELTYQEKKDAPEIKYTAYWMRVGYREPKFICTMVTKSGKKIWTYETGGKYQSFDYGPSTYQNHYSSEQAASSAWERIKYDRLRSTEYPYYEAAVNYFTPWVGSWAPFPSNLTALEIHYVYEKKAGTKYADTREAKDIFIKAVNTTTTDKIVEINRIITPEYYNRKDSIRKAVAMWERMLSEANYEKKDVRINEKVARYIYFNLTLGYTFLDSFAKAREYLQGRKEFGKGIMAGLKKLEKVIDFWEERQKQLKNFPILLTDDKVYVYKDLETKRREAAEEQARVLAAQKATKDSLDAVNNAKTKIVKPKTPLPKATVKPKAAGNKPKPKT